MKRRSFIALALAAAVGGTLTACADMQSREAGWIVLFDGRSIDRFVPVGDANWRIVDGVLQADRGVGFLVSRDSYRDFQLRAEFWADEEANSGIFLRLADPLKITPANAYEVNIFDQRPDPTYGTGAIVDLAKVAAPLPKVANRWNTYDIVARGSHFVVVLNGVKTVDLEDGRRAAGPIAVQSAGGTIKFRKIEIRPL